ncbi:MAG TPA: hypothetical protein VGL40_00115 [Bacillota bacterium]|jgi:uncharacterized protein YycO
MRGHRFRHLLSKQNSVDFARLEPGDIVLCANPHDASLLRTFLFWSHAGLYTGLPEAAKAFVDAVDLPVRRRSERRLPWQRVRFTSKRMYLSYVDILVLRVDCSKEKREAAAAFAVAQVGKPFPRHLFRTFFRLHDQTAFTCTSLVYHAYRGQGVDLSPRILLGRTIPWPSSLARHPRIEEVARGTRWRPIPLSVRNWRPIIQRLWFRYVIRTQIILNLKPSRPAPEPGEAPR